MTGDDPAARSVQRQIDDVRGDLDGYVENRARVLARRAMLADRAATLADPERAATLEARRALGIKKGSGRAGRTIPGRVRVAIARAAGVGPGESGPVACAYCGAFGVITFDPMGARDRVGYAHLSPGWQFDHVEANHRGGQSTDDNVVVACQPCNRRKSGR